MLIVMSLTVLLGLEKAISAERPLGNIKCRLPSEQWQENILEGRKHGFLKNISKFNSWHTFWIF